MGVLTITLEQQDIPRTTWEERDEIEQAQREKWRKRYQRSKNARKYTKRQNSSKDWRRIKNS